MIQSMEWVRIKEQVTYEERKEEYRRFMMGLSFPQDKKEIAKLSYDEKMEWYWSRDPKIMVWLGNNKEFQNFWKWRVLIPMKAKRFYYRIKNFEIFKKYQHISEMKKKVKKFSI